MLHGIVELGVVAFGAYALLAPRSPFSIAMLRERGPRLDHARLLRSEIRDSAKSFASLALGFGVATQVALLVTSRAAPRGDEEKLPYFVAVLTLGGIAAFFACCALRSLLAAWLRSAADDAAILRARLPADAPEEIGPEALAAWASMRGLPLTDRAPARNVDEILGVDVALYLLVAGSAGVLLGLLGAYNSLSEGARVESLWAPVLAAAIGAAGIVLAVRVDRARKRRAR